MNVRKVTIGSWSLLEKGGGIEVCNKNRRSKGCHISSHYMPGHAELSAADSGIVSLLYIKHKDDSVPQNSPIHTGCTDLKTGHDGWRGGKQPLTPMLRGISDNSM